MLFRFCCLALAAIWIAGCGTMAAAPEAKRQTPRAGAWSLAYTGGCAGRESETIQVTRLDDAELVFDEFRLRRNTEGVFEGSADFIAPMPADGRDVIYTIAYALSLSDDGIFTGSESITEDGGESLDCPIQLVFAGA